MSKKSCTKFWPALRRKVCGASRISDLETESATNRRITELLSWLHEFLLLDRLPLVSYHRPVVLSIACNSSRAHDPIRAGDSGNESPELPGSAARGDCMRSSDLLSGSANTIGCAGARLVSAKAERDPGESRKHRSPRY